MSDLQIPEPAQTGVWVHILGAFLPLREFTQKEKNATYNKAGEKLHVDMIDCPAFWLFADPRNPNARSNGVRGIAGTLDGLGDVAVILDGEVHDIALVDGLTGKDGDKKRNPKKSGTLRGVEFDGRTMNLAVLASQTAPGILFVQASVTNQSPIGHGGTTAPVSVVDLFGETGAVIVG